MKKIGVLLISMLCGYVTYAQNYNEYLEAAQKHLYNGDIGKAQSAYSIFQQMTNKSDANFERLLNAIVSQNDEFKRKQREFAILALLNIDNIDNRYLIDDEMGVVIDTKIKYYYDIMETFTQKRYINTKKFSLATQSELIQLSKYLDPKYYYIHECSWFHRDDKKPFLSGIALSGVYYGNDGKWKRFSGYPTHFNSTTMFCKYKSKSDYDNDKDYEREGGMMSWQAENFRCLMIAQIPPEAEINQYIQQFEISSALKNTLKINVLDRLKLDNQDNRYVIDLKNKIIVDTKSYEVTFDERIFKTSVWDGTYKDGWRIATTYELLDNIQYLEHDRFYIGKGQHKYTDDNLFYAEFLEYKCSTNSITASSIYNFHTATIRLNAIYVYDIENFIEAK